MSQTKAQLLDPQGDFTLTGQLIGVGATFSGNVSIAGTLTKQDVTNVDSVGVITARQGVVVPDGEGYKFGDGSYRIEGKDDGANARIGFVAGGSERVRIDGTGRVGIGTDSASALLHIEGTQTNLWLERNTQTLKIDANYGNGGDQSLTASAALRFYTGGANERLRINSSGNVSINNTNIEKRFSVKETSTSVPAGGGVYYNAAIGGSAGTAGYAVGIAFDPEGSDARYKNAIVSEATGDGYSRGKLHFLLDSANDSGEATLNESRLTILDSGKVGIGTNNPTRGPLHVHENSTGDVQIHLTNQETGTTSSDGFTIFSGGNAGPNAGFVNREDGGTIAFYTHNGSSVGVRLTLSHTGNLTSTGTVSDSKGDLRKIPINFHNAGTYTLVASDAGKVVSEATNGANITVPASVFSGGDAITIMNHNSGNTTITQGSGLTMYFANDGSTGNRTLATRGFCTLFFREPSVVYISGAGLS